MWSIQRAGCFMVAFVSFDWFCGSVTGATFFRGITHGDRRIKVAEFQPMQSPVAAGFSLQSCWWKAG